MFPKFHCKRNSSIIFQGLQKIFQHWIFKNENVSRRSRNFSLENHRIQPVRLTGGLGFGFFFAGKLIVVEIFASPRCRLVSYHIPLSAGPYLCGLIARTLAGRTRCA